MTSLLEKRLCSRLPIKVVFDFPALSTSRRTSAELCGIFRTRSDLMFFMFFSLFIHVRRLCCNSCCGYRHGLVLLWIRILINLSYVYVMYVLFLSCNYVYIVLCSSAITNMLFSISGILYYFNENLFSVISSVPIYGLMHL